MSTLLNLVGRRGVFQIAQPLQQISRFFRKPTTTGRFARCRAVCCWLGGRRSVLAAELFCSDLNQGRPVLTVLLLFDFAALERRAALYEARGKNRRARLDRARLETLGR